MGVMIPWKIGAFAALIAGSAACTAAVDERPLTAVEKSRLLREYEAAETRRRLGGQPERPGCASSTSASRLIARRTGYSGSDSFDSRGCPEETAGRGPSWEEKE